MKNFKSFLAFISLTNVMCYAGVLENFVNFDISQWETEYTSNSVSYKIDTDVNCVDNKCLILELPAGYNLTGPVNGINIKSKQKFHYGEYIVRMKSAKTINQVEGVVSAFFTYFNDYWTNPVNYTDINNNGISDNSEIDIELLSAEPQVIYMTIWTDYDEVGDTPRFRKVTRKLNVATGDIYETPVGKEDTYDLEYKGKIDTPYNDFNHTQNFYEYSFIWSSNSVRFYLTINNNKIILWEFNREHMIPKNPAYIMCNLWHNSTHWHNNQQTLPPSTNVFAKFDYIIFNETTLNSIPVKEQYILDSKNNFINFGKVKEVKIFDITQNLVITLTDVYANLIKEEPSEYSEKIWYGKDYNGKKVKSGVYLYQIEDIKNNYKIGRILVLR